MLATDVSLECISYTGTVGTEENLDFELPVYDIVSKTLNTFLVAGNKAFYFRPNDIITATHAGGSTNFVVVNSLYNGTNTVITVSEGIDTGIDYTQIIAMERGTRDGQILWTLVDDVTNITYPWNGYVVFDHELEIVE